ncbi:hypothetical protein HYPSUDRAFT_82395 [Hypholoma sublateritium FD-334 SS-4]|uniref:Transmembrane protein n=1 Tax=Hypholoma sublateritium (strain FD-334 SS-4) TaxID=945553 RepID=A0A0D2MXM2_HYPSF|nr:hypothetical protein HYPSUDRAFT_82395 [Hypholoma sublateritium FD-334 SS-4]
MSILASAANAGLTGGLVLHILAAFISFLAGFFLVRYKIKWAHTERLDMARKRAATQSRHTCDRKFNVPTPPTSNTFPKSNESLSPTNISSSLHGKVAKMSESFAGCPSTLLTLCLGRWDEGPFIPCQIRRVPTRLLGRFYFMCVVLTLLGFIFSVIGLICDAYDRLPSIIGSVAITVISVTFLAVLVIFLLPERVGDEIQEE